MIASLLLMHPAEHCMGMVQGKDVGSQWMHNYRPSDAQLAILSRAVDGGETHGGPNNLAPPSLPGNYNQQVRTPV